jgi:hypothetical protein
MGNQTIFERSYIDSHPDFVVTCDLNLISEIRDEANLMQAKLLNRILEQRKLEISPVVLSSWKIYSMN